jgi:hypothetical protein
MDLLRQDVRALAIEPVRAACSDVRRLSFFNNQEEVVKRLAESISRWMRVGESGL